MRRCLDAAQRSAIAQAAVAALTPAPATAKGAVAGHNALSWMLALEVSATPLMTAAAFNKGVFVQAVEWPAYRNFCMRNYFKPGVLLLTANT